MAGPVFMQVIPGERENLAEQDHIFSHRASLRAATYKGLIWEEKYPCSDIVANIWQPVSAPAIFFHKICYAAAKIAHLQASFFQGRRLNVRCVF